ncbi:MAG: MFS transporter [Gemmatimonadaceae bacterium]
MSEPDRIIPRRAVASWILYDVANVIFTMGVVSLKFPLFVRESVGAQRADSVYGAITSVAMGIMFLLSPLLGAMTDRARRRMPFLIWATLLCCACTALIARGPFMVSIVLFVLANGGYQACVQFYDSMLPDVTTEKNRGRVGGLAVGLGYLGSYIAIGMGIVIATGQTTYPFTKYFTLVAILFLLIAIPCFLFVKERGNPNPRPIFTFNAIRESVSQTIATLRAGEKYPGLLRFLIGRAFYTDAINTVVSFMSLYTVNVAVSTGLTQEQGHQKADIVLASAVTAAIFGGIIWGRVVDSIGPKRTLNLVLFGWLGTFALAACVGLFGLPIVFLFAVAVLAGIFLGGTWAADRPLMLRLTPPDRVGEFYGLYGMVGRFSAVTGPAIWAFTTYLVVERGGKPEITGEGTAVISLLLMVVVSLFILRAVTDTPRDWETLHGAPATSRP